MNYKFFDLVVGLSSNKLVQFLGGLFESVKWPAVFDEVDQFEDAFGPINVLLNWF